MSRNSDSLFSAFNNRFYDRRGHSNAHALAAYLRDGYLDAHFSDDSYISTAVLRTSIRILVWTKMRRRRAVTLGLERR